MRRWRMLGVLGLLLAGMGWGPTAAASAFGDCASPAYVRQFDRAGLLDNTCRVVSVETLRHSGGSAALRLLAVEGEGEFVNEDALKLVFRRLAGRASEALTALPGLRVNNVSVLVTRIPPDDHDSGSPTDAWATTYVEGGECRITQFWPMESTTRDYFMFLIAHEIFHCVQQATEFSLTRHADSSWWMEGTAEYFANLTYPGTEFSDGFVSDFDAQSPRARLGSLDYASVAFFFWLAQRDGPRAIVDFIRQMAALRGNPLEALRAVLPPADFKRFGEAYMDGEIRQPGGREMASVPRSGRDVRIDGPTTLQVRSALQVLRRERWTFAPGKIYEVRQVSMPPGTSVGFSPKRGKWSGPPERVLACTEAQVYRVLATTMDAGGEAVYEITVPEGLQNATACCMVGTWKPTEAAREGEIAFLLDAGGPALGAEGAGVECDAPANDWTLDFGADGRGTLDWNGFTLHCRAGKPGDGKLDQTWTRSGRMNFEWTSEREGAATVRHLDSNMAMHIAARIGPMVMMDQTRPYPPPSVEFNDIAVTCRRDDLRVEGLYTLGHRSETHVREVPPEPEP